MRQMLSSLLKQFLARKVEALLALLVPIVIVAIEAAQSYLVQFVPEPKEVWALRSLALAIASLFIAALSYIYFRPKLKPLPFGVHQDAKTGAYFCSRCYLKDKKHFPLETTSNGWKCSVCGQWKQDPNNPVVPLSTAHHWNDKP